MFWMTMKLMLSLFVSLSVCLSLFGFHSSDSESHFDTPEAATPVHTLPTFPGELENSNADPDKAGEATAEQILGREKNPVQHMNTLLLFIYFGRVKHLYYQIQI